MSYGVKIAIKLNNCMLRSNVTGNKQRRNQLFKPDYAFSMYIVDEYDDTVVRH